MAEKNTPNDIVDTSTDVSILHYNVYDLSITKGGKNCPSFLLPQIGAMNEISHFSYLARV
jgi:hypothetical protein